MNKLTTVTALLLSASLFCWNDAEASTRKIPVQPYRGWMYYRVPVPVTEAKIRFKIPYDLPAPVHFHVAILPEKDAETFMGDRAVWPKIWLVDKRYPPAILLSHSRQVKGWGATSMTLRVSSSVLKVPPAVHLTDWAFDPSAGGPLKWKWTEITSAFHAHDVTSSHALMEEFSRGSRTPWLNLTDLMGNLPVDTKSVLVGVAPYYGPLGKDHAFTCYPSRGAPNPTSAYRLRSEADYPNDPLMIWEYHHDEVAPSWRPKVKSEWQNVFGAVNTPLKHYEQFSEAWLAGALRLSLWNTQNPSVSADVAIQREVGGNPHSVPRFLPLGRGVDGLASNSARWAATTAEAYSRAFRVYMGSLKTRAPLAGVSWTQKYFGLSLLPALDRVEVQGCFNAWGYPLDPALITDWGQNMEVVLPGFLTVFNKWLDRIGDYFDALDKPPQGAIDDWLLFPMMEYYGGGQFQLAWQGANGLLNYGVVIGSYTSTFNDPANYTIMSAVINVHFQSYGVSGLNALGFYNPISSSSVADLRPPLAWVSLLPPVFGQTQSFSSMEMMNVAWDWWRRSAGALASSSTFNLVGLNQNDFPWPGWFPADGAPNDSSPVGWWSQYQTLPWARLMKGADLPTWTSKADFRFDGTPHAWSNRIDSPVSWSPQPPVAPVGTDGDRYPSVVLPTAAYRMGPIEIKFIP